VSVEVSAQGNQYLREAAEEAIPEGQGKSLEADRGGPNDSIPVQAPQRSASSAMSARVGDIRLIYTVDENQELVILLYVGHRERVYE
jgi:mRNA-degrading endonuclease RelE of RelBE toxin-antitoxin system